MGKSFGRYLQVFVFKLGFTWDETPGGAFTSAVPNALCSMDWLHAKTFVFFFRGSGDHAQDPGTRTLYII